MRTPDQRRTDTINAIGILLIAFLCGAVLSALSGCETPPPPEPPPPVPEAVPFPQPVLDAIAEIHGPSTCTLPLLRTVSHPQYLELTATCGSGACQGCGMACTSAQLLDGAVVTVPTAWPGVAIDVALKTLHACEGSEYDHEAYLDVLVEVGLWER